jgi:hypothetical protein
MTTKEKHGHSSDYRGIGSRILELGSFMQHIQRSEVALTRNAPTHWFAEVATAHYLKAQSPDRVVSHRRGFGHMMVCKDLSTGGGKKPSPKKSRCTSGPLPVAIRANALFPRGGSDSPEGDGTISAVPQF